jgi:hypothetical protein
VNNTAVAAAHNKMTAINSAIEVDLTGEWRARSRGASRRYGYPCRSRLFIVVVAPCRQAKWCRIPSDPASTQA